MHMTNDNIIDLTNFKNIINTKTNLATNPTM